MLELQANAWKAKIAGAKRALACVEAARHRLQCRHDLSIDDLCNLIKTLDGGGSIGMQSATSIMRDLINELVTPDEERAWITWWTMHAADAAATKAFVEEQDALFFQVKSLADQGADPASPDAQRLIEEHDAILLRHGVRERTLRLLDWNSTVTHKFYSLGAEARSRGPKESFDPAQRPPILVQSVAEFLAAARKASPRAPIVKGLLSDASALIDAHSDPAAAEADDLVRRWRQVCLEDLLGDPYAVARCAPFFGRVSRVDPGELKEQAWEFIARAIRARSGESAAL